MFTEILAQRTPGKMAPSIAEGAWYWPFWISLRDFLCDRCAKKSTML
jgi:hypothetical protein